MRTKKNFSLLMLSMATVGVGFGLAACTSDDGENGAPTNVVQPLEIRLSSSIGDGTRTFDEQNLLSGDTVWVWADMINGSTGVQTEYFKAWALKANGAGGLSTLAAGNTKLFPATNELNFYALVGNFGVETEGDRAGQPLIEAEEMALPTTGIRHTVLSDQTLAEAYYKSDLLYAVKKHQEPISSAVVLPFRHMLSRVEVVLVAGNGMTTAELSAATVDLLNMKRQVTLSPDSTADYTQQTAREAMLSIPMGAGEGNIRMNTNVVASATSADVTAQDSRLYADAIVVPQQLAAGTRFVRVSYLGEDTYYTIPTGGLRLESGKQYRFRLVADRIGNSYEFEPIQIEEWGAATTPNGLWLDTIEN